MTCPSPAPNDGSRRRARRPRRRTTPSERRDEPHDTHAARHRAGATVRRTAADDRVRRLPCDVRRPWGMSGDSNWRLPVDPCHTPHRFRRAGEAHAMTKPFPSQVSPRSAHARVPQPARTDTRARSPHPTSAHPRPPAVAGRPILEPRVVCGQQMRSRCRRTARRAKIRAMARLRAERVDAMKQCDRHVSCRCYARLRPSLTAVATDPLSARIPQNAIALDRRISCHSWQIGHYTRAKHSPVT